MDNPCEARAGNKGEHQCPSHVSPQGGQLAPAESRAAFLWANRLEMAPTTLQELHLGLVKCCSVGLRHFSGNETQGCRCCWYKLIKMHWQFQPHIEEGLVSAAMWARATWREVSPELVLSFQWLQGTSAGSDSFFQHCWLELGKTSVEGIWHLQLTQFNCRQNSGVFIENSVSMKIPNQTLWLWIKKYLWIKKWNTISDVEIPLYSSSCFWFLLQPPHKRNVDKTYTKSSRGRDFWIVFFHMEKASLRQSC